MKTGLILTNGTIQPMISTIESTSLMAYKRFRTVIDVRSPSEFSQGHIPGAINIPVFSDEERAQIGTLYTCSGPDTALVRGLDIAIPRTGEYLGSLKASAPQGPVMVHCWRGGLRSAAMAEVFSQAGYEVSVLSGGYKIYRRQVREVLSKPRAVLILGGYTGSGKTEVLRELQRMGEQTIDLEELACHKGSVFGALGKPPQPTNEQFENNLCHHWVDLDPGKPVWIEDESRMIGNVTLPEPMVEKLSRSVMIRLNIEKAFRIERLVNDYARFDKSVLAGAIEKIRLRLGGTETNMALEALRADDFNTVAEITLKYYDKAYLHTLERRRDLRIYDLETEDGHPRSAAQKILEFVKLQALHETDLLRL